MFFNRLIFFHSDGTITGPRVDDFIDAIKGLQCSSHVIFDGCNKAKIVDKETFLMDSPDFYTIRMKVENIKHHMFTVETFCVDKEWFKQNEHFDNLRFKDVWKVTNKGRFQFIEEQSVGEIVLEDV